MKTDSARRDFLRTGACALGALLMPQGSSAANGPLARRVPKTGEAIPAVGLGTWQVFDVATKVWTSGRQAGIRQMEDSMRKLRVERLDLMQVHNLVDASTHLATLREWKNAGRVRYLGVTHYHAGAHADLEKIIRPGDIDFVQVNYSLAEPEAERRLLAAAADSRTAVIVNRPFAEE